MNRIITFLLLLITCNLAFADTGFSMWGTSKQYVGSSADGVCEQHYNERQKFVGAEQVANYTVVYDGANYLCKLMTSSGKQYSSSPIQYSGCAEGSSLSGSACVADRQCKKDDLMPVKGYDSPVFWSDTVQQMVVADTSPTKLCVRGCWGLQDTGQYPKKCYLVSGTVDKGFCNQVYIGTGENCSGGDDVANSGNGDPLPTRPPEPCSGDGCGNDTETPEEPDEPEDNQCPEGYTWSGSLCVPNGGDDEDEGGSGSGSGGGNNGGSSGSGSGGGGGGGGSGGSTGIGDGDGEGEGDGEGNGGSGSWGDGDGDGEGGDKSSVNGGITCDQPLICKGDAVQCSQLEKQHQIKCAQEELYKKDDDIDAQLQQLVDKNTHKIKGLGEEAADEVNMGDLISKGSGWLPRGCPSSKTVNVKGTTLTFSFAEICKVASWFSGVVVALFSFLGLRVFGR